MVNIIKKRIRHWIDRALFGNRFPLVPAMESVYQQVVQRELGRLKIEDRFYPLGGAANYGLFYQILRSISDYPIKQVLELGAGQSSLLFEALVRVDKLRANVCTVEHDIGWAEKIAKEVSHNVVRTNLVPKNIAGISFSGYDFSLLANSAIELLVIDGPPATTTETMFSRLGAIELLSHVDLTRFIIVVDDAERQGEMLLASEIISHLKKYKAGFAVNQIVSNKRQVVIAGGAYIGAAFY